MAGTRTSLVACAAIWKRCHRQKTRRSHPAWMMLNASVRLGPLVWPRVWRPDEVHELTHVDVDIETFRENCESSPTQPGTRTLRHGSGILCHGRPPFAQHDQCCVREGSPPAHSLKITIRSVTPPATARGRAGRGPADDCLPDPQISTRVDSISAFCDASMRDCQDG